MRLISVNNLQGGEIIGRDIVSSNGGTLLAAHSRFRLAYKNKLIERGIEEIYIDDEFSKGIEPTPLLTTRAKQILLEGIEEQFQRMENKLSIEMNNVNELTSFLLDHLPTNELIFDILDIKKNDNNTYQHSLGVAILAAMLSRKMNMNATDIHSIAMGGLLHDMGKIIVPKDILNKPGKLTSEEYNMIKEHTQIGYDMIKEDVSISAITKVAVLCHHERENGQGYPLGMKKDLHIAGKIVAVCDVFDALVSDRPYRKGLDVDEAIDLMRSEALNQEIVNDFEAMIARYPIGSIVALSNGYTAIVEKHNQEDLLKPKIRVLLNEKGERMQSFSMDLLKESAIKIVKKLDDIPFNIRDH